MSCLRLADDQLLPIAPLKHTLPEVSSSDAQQRQQQDSPQERLAAAAASSFLHGCSPLGVKTRDRPPAAAAPAAAAPQPLRAAAAQPQLRDVSVLKQQHDDTLSRSFRQHSQLLELEHEQQQVGHAPEQGQGQPHAAGGDAAEGQGLGSPAFERAGSINHRPLPYDEPDTPVNVADTADNTSCSGTPNTPAGMRADATGGAGQLVSPSEYVTPPQHRLRASRPLAPLHKDCLIAAATRSLADGLAAQQQQCAAKQQASSSLAARAAAGGAGGAGADSPGQCSGDSSRILSCERLMDSPLEAAGLNHSSPSQWHQGMVAMLRSLQQTPLQTKGPAAGAGIGAGGGAAAAGTPAAAASAAGAISGGSSPAEMAGIKVCSRALRRLQDELERGSAATAAAAAALMAKQQRQQRQGEQRPARQEQQAGGGQKDSDAQVVPFPAGPPSMAPTVSAAGVPSCSTPMVLPLFTTPAAAPGSSRLPAKGSPGSSAAPRNSTTPLALAPQCSSGLASVSLTPAVVTLHTPAGSAAASAVTPRMPAMAWPVQQRADGGFGFVVSAPTTGGGAAAAGMAASTAAAAAASGAVVQLTPAASCTKAGAGTGATPFPPAAAAATPAAATAGTAGQLWQQATPLSVVNIQPLTLLQSALALQPGAAAATVAGAGPAAAGVPEQLWSAGVPGSGAAAPAALRDSSHAIRSRLHALIDSV